MSYYLHSHGILVFTLLLHENMHMDTVYKYSACFWCLVAKENPCTRFLCIGWTVEDMWDKARQWRMVTFNSSLRKTRYTSLLYACMTWHGPCTTKLRENSTTPRRAKATPSTTHVGFHHQYFLGRENSKELCVMPSTRRRDMGRHWRVQLIKAKPRRSTPRAWEVVLEACR
jgi:hypothetical protein